jgi:signal-transduction protein with cAMP-binding, CBS, and nucleotidyltransferase domain
MEQKLIAYFSKFRALSKEEEAAITNGINIRDFKKGTILLREGQKTHDNFFVFKGCVRQYIIKGGEERTTNFFTEEDWILPAIGQFNNPVSNSYLECIEDSILLIANENEGLELMKTQPEISKSSLKWFLSRK